MIADTKTATIAGYKRFLIQKGTSTLYDTKAQWGMVAKTNPYPIIPEMKEPYKNDWKDENGDDEYVESASYKAFELTVSFYVKASASGQSSAVRVLRGYLDSFFAVVKEGFFKVYDEYTDLGFQNVRFVSCKEQSFKARGTWAATTIEVKFKVDDPVTRMILSNGSIVEEA